MSYTDNPIYDFNMWDMEQQEQLARLPVCADCGEPIQSDYAYEGGAGLICENCLEDYKKPVDENARCADCGERIERAYNFGEWICSDCMERNYKRAID